MSKEAGAVQARLQEIVERYGVHVLCRCRMLARHPQEAEDLAQEIFARLCEVVAKPDRERKDIPWSLAAAIMENVFLEYLRDKVNRKKLLRDESVLKAAPVSEAEQRAEQEDEHRMVRELVKKLRPSEQQVILGRHVLDMDFVKLAQRLRVPRTTLFLHYRQAIQRLRKMAMDRGLLP